MSRMLELVRSSALPSHQMMSAARGALPVPSEEMVEILVFLAEHNKIFSQQAKLTLANWDEASSKAVASNPKSPKEVLEYWLSSKNIRPTLFPFLIENPSVSFTKLAELAAALKGEWIDAMLASTRVRSSRAVLLELASNKELDPAQVAKVQELLTGKSAAIETVAQPATAVKLQVPENEAAAVPATAALQDSEAADPEVETAVITFLTEHAAEIAAEGDKPFQPIGGIYDPSTAEEPVKAVAAAATAQPAPHTFAPKKIANPQDEQRGSVLQKISRLDIKGRIQLAMKGNKEERAILVRDGTKIVALAVLDSAKITDGEVERFAGQKNVLEALLRAIPMKRRFAKNYAVVRNLVSNPRTPLDTSLGLMKNLLVADLKNLSGNKEVADTIRKLALRLFKQKIENPNRR
ncbi:MAG: hypothetical protein QOF94_1980 [Acidobacteriaceae bacterium]